MARDWARQPDLGNQQAQECGPWPEKSLKIQVSKSEGKEREEAPGRLKEEGQAGGMGTFWKVKSKVGNLTSKRDEKRRKPREGIETRRKGSSHWSNAVRTPLRNTDCGFFPQDCQQHCPCPLCPPPTTGPNYGVQLPLASDCLRSGVADAGVPG